MTNDTAFDLVCEAIAEVLMDTGVSRDDVSLESCLVRDLCMESIRFVDLTVALEALLGLPMFPMQDWIDAQLADGGHELRVDALVAFCQTLTMPRA